MNRSARVVDGRRPRVLWVSYSGTWVGPTNSLSLLLEHLRGRFDSTVLLTGQGAFTELLEQRGIPYDLIPTMGKRKLLEVARYIHRGDFDLVYGNCSSGVSATAALASTMARVPFVHHIRSKWVDSRGLDSWMLRLAKGHVAVSMAAAEAFERYVKGTSTRVVYNGVPVDVPPHPRESARRGLLAELELDESAVLMLSVGHVMTRKGQLDAVSAMEHVVQSAPNAVLLLVGRLDREPEYVRQLEERVRDLGLERNVRLLGFRRDIDGLTAASDVQVHTAGIDPHPRSVLEGMLGGLPTVAYAVDGVAETVADGTTGVLVPANDVAGLARGMTDLSIHRERRAVMGAAARARVVSRFDAAETARQVGDIIEETLGARTRDVPAQEKISERSPQRSPISIPQNPLSD